MDCFSDGVVHGRLSDYAGLPQLSKPAAFDAAYTISPICPEALMPQQSQSTRGPVMPLV